MLIRWFRFLKPSSTGPYHPSSENIKLLTSLSRPDSFSHDKIESLLISIGKLSSSLSKLDSLKSKPEYKILLQTLPLNISILVPDLKSEDFYRISHSLFMLKLYDPKLLTILSKTFISRHLDNASLFDISKFLFGYTLHQEKDSEFWTSIEKKINAIVYAKGGKITFPTLKNILKSFIENNQGSEKFRIKLWDSMIKDLGNVNTENLTDIAYILTKMNPQDKNIINQFFKFAVKNIENYDDNSLHKILQACIRLKADCKYLKELEMNTKGKLKEIPTKSMNEYIYVYREYFKVSMDLIEERKYFISELESNYEKIHMNDMQESLKNEYIRLHVRALNLFLKAGVVKNMAFWKKVYKEILDFSLVNDDKVMSKFIKEIEETEWAKHNR